MGIWYYGRKVVLYWKRQVKLLVLFDAIFILRASLYFMATRLLDWLPTSPPIASLHLFNDLNSPPSFLGCRRDKYRSSIPAHKGYDPNCNSLDRVPGWLWSKPTRFHMKIRLESWIYYWGCSKKRFKKILTAMDSIEVPRKVDSIELPRKTILITIQVKNYRCLILPIAFEHLLAK